MLLILGAGRSGTTFLGKLFDSHPDVVYRHEPDSVAVRGDIPFHPERGSWAHHRQQARDYLHQLARGRYVKSVGHPPFFRKTWRGRGGEALFQGTVHAMKLAERAGGRGLRRHLQVPDFGRTGDGAAYPVVKSVNSLCRARLFAEADTDARIVHIIRHPCAVIASMARGERSGLMGRDIYLDTVFGLREASAYGLSRGFMEKASVDEQRAFQWLVFNDKVMAEMEGDPRYRLVRYEDLCLDPAGMARQLFAFAGLPWARQTEDFLGGLEGRDGQAGYFSVMRNPREGLDRWRSELTGEQIERVMAIAERGPSGRLYGMSAATVPAAPKASHGVRMGGAEGVGGV